MAKSLCDHPLAYVMEARGWSHRDLVAAIQQEAMVEKVNMSAARGKVWKWMNGTMPDRITQLLLARRLGIPAAEVDARPWPLWLPAHSGIRTDYTQDHHGALAAVTELGEGVDGPARLSADKRRTRGLGDPRNMAY